MAKYLVTGGTGLIGSNVCRLLIEGGDQVRALVRPGSDYEPLTAIGVEAFLGDVRSKDDMVGAANDCHAIVHSAALLGGTAQDADEQHATNATGSFHAYGAGAKHGIRVVALSSTPFLDHDATLTEDSPVAEHWSDDPYTRTKGAAYVEGMRRVAEEGADIVTVIPGGTFGPGLSLARAMAATSYNRALRGAVNGKLRQYVSFPVPWVLAEDAAAAVVSAISKGIPGRKYLALGREDARTTAALLNLACQAAGVPHRVAELVVDPDDPEHLRVFGATLVELSQRTYPVPWFDNCVTRAELGYSPRPLEEGLAITVDWLRANGQIPAAA